ncbi:MAG: NAD+ synthase, partial [Theionarchaea archaeon]|nr:NAD+ synthase [Theionarchaea archaeon]
RIVGSSSGVNLIVGFVDMDSDLYNAAAIVSDGKIAGIYHKIHLPNYGVFDENRYFSPGRDVQIYEISGVKLGISICEDIWQETGPAGVQAASGAEVLVNISASPYHHGKGDYRLEILGTKAKSNLAAVAYGNLIGGQDELVFDGNSLIIDHRGKLLNRGRQFEEDLVAADIDVESIFRDRLHDPRWREGAKLLEEKGARVVGKVISRKAPGRNRPRLPEALTESIGYPDEVYEALVLGTRDYVRKNGFEKVVIGLSGGIDSSLVGTIAADALGSENVTGVWMPSRYSSADSMNDAAKLADNLEIRLVTLPIDGLFQSYLETLSVEFEGTEVGIAEENLQARIRGNLLMALSNKFGCLVLATGNKSEMATGYSTLYGDMCGGLSVIKDVPKTMVYELARYKNEVEGREVIPERILTKEPSAELRPDQRDTDSLPPYDVLDPILEAYVEQDRSIDEIVSMGFAEDVVRRAIGLVDRSEYKRRQSTPGIKITPRAFGKDRRLPITNRFNP